MNSDEWILADLHQYQIKCEICNQIIIIKQYGDELNLKLLKKVLNEVHINANYDFFTKYENNIKIDTEIINSKCFKKPI